MFARVCSVVVTMFALAACPRPARSTIVKPTPERGAITPHADAPTISWVRVAGPEDVPSAPPEPGTYRVHLIDVGTGLSVLVQGADFALLYDGGSNDPDEKPLRVVAYLAAALGPSGDDLCVERGAEVPTKRVRLEHVVLSHPHLDHGSALDLVVHCYDVQNVWDSGRINQAVFYREFVAAVGASATARYHTAADVPADHTVRIKGTPIEVSRWERFSEADVVELGAGARFEILHADAKAKPDPNQNSLVIAVDLGGARVLLVGDAESGEREDPREPAGDVEEFLIEQHPREIRAEILQVGHHGSMTSSRDSFLAAVKPKLALVSAGPKRYGKVVLPDGDVLAALAAAGAEILRTDAHDGECPAAVRIGGNRGPGGCDSYVITIAPAEREKH